MSSIQLQRSASVRQIVAAAFLIEGACVLAQSFTGSRRRPNARSWPARRQTGSSAFMAAQPAADRSALLGVMTPLHFIEKSESPYRILDHSRS